MKGEGPTADLFPLIPAGLVGAGRFGKRHSMTQPCVLCCFRAALVRDEHASAAWGQKKDPGPRIRGCDLAVEREEQPANVAILMISAKLRVKADWLRESSVSRPSIHDSKKTIGYK